MQIIQDHWLTSMMQKNCYTIPEGAIKNLQFRFKKNSLYQSTLNIQSLDETIILHKLNFKIITYNVLFEGKKEQCLLSTINKKNNKYKFEISSISDSEQVSKIAEKSFKFDRFHVDPKISNIVADKIKREWIKNFYSGNRGDMLIVAKLKRHVCGFILLKLNMDTAIIDLIAVDISHAGQGIGLQLINSSLKNTPKYIKYVRVGTQLDNIISLSMYRSAGLKNINNTVSMHLHV